MACLLPFPNSQPTYKMDELSPFGIGFAVTIFCLACLMAIKLSSKKAYH